MSPVVPPHDTTATVWRTIEQLRAAVDEVLSGLESQPLPAANVLAVAESLGHLVGRLRAAHTLAIGQARSSGMWAIDGYATSTSWLRDSHLLDGHRARELELTATWLDAHPRTREAFTTGKVTPEHIFAIRRVTAACPRRARAYPTFEEDLLQVAANADPQRTLAVLKAWADALDSTSADDESVRQTNRRAFFLSPVADGWDLRGYLPGPAGAELAGVLNEIMAARRRDSSDDVLDPPATRRADALLDLARAVGRCGGTDDAPAGYVGPNTDTSSGPARGTHGLAPVEGGTLMGPGGRHRARILVTVPLPRLLALREDDPWVISGSVPPRGPGEPTPVSRRATSGPDQAARVRDGLTTPETEPYADPLLAAGTWRCGNGAGDGFLAMRDVLRLSCDGEIQRLVLDANSQPLDIGRATRVVPPAMRTALDLRDRGCIMPGCQRPPSWCEAHHIQHWSAGGPTSLSNLALLCSRHHHELHNGVWTITHSPTGRPVAVRKAVPRTRPEGRRRPLPPSPLPSNAYGDSHYPDTS